MSKDRPPKKLSFRKKVLFTLISSFIIVVFLLVFLELIFLLFNPQPYQYPTLKFSSEYKKIYHSNVRMKSHFPPETRYYSTNEMGFRKSSCNLSLNNNKETIAILGDSFTFGIGVNDGLEFPAIMAKELEEGYNVMNFGVGGWGLTQEIKVFYELAQKYNPQHVIIVFFSNDPYDNLLDPVLKVKDDAFQYIDVQEASGGLLSKLSKSLSNSILQKSNLYNYIRNMLYLKFHEQAVQDIDDTEVLDEIPEGEANYCELLRVFANDLKSKNIKLHFISVNYEGENTIESELSRFPFIEDYVNELDSLEILNYIPINSWFTSEDMAPSPVSHFDVKWNEVLGKNLANQFVNSAE